MIIFVLLFFISSSGFADGEILFHNRKIMSAEPTQSTLCEASDAECATWYFKILSGLQLGRTTVAGGYSGKDEKGIFAAKVNGISADFPIGKGEILALEWKQKSFMLSFLDFTSLYFCQHEDGTQHAPFWGAMFDRCKSEGTWGLEFALLSMQVDDRNKRLLNEWFRFGASFNPLSNGHSFSHNRFRLQLFANIDDLHLKGYARETNHIGVNVGTRGLFRTSDARWQLSADLNMRQGLFQGSRDRENLFFQQQMEVAWNQLSGEMTILQPALAFEHIWKQRNDLPVLGWMDSRQQQDFRVWLRLRLLPGVNL